MFSLRLVLYLSERLSFFRPLNLVVLLIVFVVVLRFFVDGKVRYYVAVRAGIGDSVGDEDGYVFVQVYADFLWFIASIQFSSRSSVQDPMQNCEGMV